MSLESVRAWLADKAPEVALVEHGTSTATVMLASAALGVEPGRVAKTLALRAGNRVVVLVTRGDSRLDNARFKAAFGVRPRMLGADEALAVTGHPVGGVCPFALATPLPIYCDRSLRDFDEVYPAAGTLTASVRIDPERLATVVGATWVEVCTVPA